MNSQVISALAQKHSDQSQSATSLSIAAKPEAQLAVPVANFSAFATEAGLGELGLIREPQLMGSNPKQGGHKTT